MKPRLKLSVFVTKSNSTTCALSAHFISLCERLAQLMTPAPLS